MRSVDQLSLVSGVVPWVIGAGGFASLAVTFARWPRRAWWTVPFAFVASVAVLVAFSGVFQLPSKLHGTWPSSFFVWCAFPIFACIASVVGWRRSRIGQRVVGVFAVVLLIGFAVQRIDSYYGAVPTVGDLIGAPLPGEIAQPAALRTVGLPSGGAGVVFPLAIAGTVSHFHARDAYVWLPPIWFTRPRPRLPALELVSGAPGSPSLWLRAGHAVQTLNAFAKAHAGWGPIVVVPDQNGSLTGDTECVDGPRGRADTYISVDVVGTINYLFGVASRARSWAIAGNSAGGTCALVMALRHPKVYGAFGDFSGDPRPNDGPSNRTLLDLFGGSSTRLKRYDPSWLLQHTRYPALLAWFASGQEDAQYRLAAIHRIAALGRRAGAHVMLITPPGTHSYYFWSRCLAKALPGLVFATSGLEPLLVKTAIHPPRRAPPPAPTKVAAPHR